MSVNLFHSSQREPQLRELNSIPIIFNDDYNIDRLIAKLELSTSINRIFYYTWRNFY